MSDPGQLLQRLKSKGYDPNILFSGTVWKCDLEVNNQVQSFFAGTELNAVKEAADYVADLEERYEEQQQRMRCEGCGG